MSARIELERDGMYRIIINGKPLEGEGGRPLRFEDRQRAAEVAEDRDDGKR